MKISAVRDVNHYLSQRRTLTSHDFINTIVVNPLQGPREPFSEPVSQNQAIRYFEATNSVRVETSGTRENSRQQVHGGIKRLGTKFYFPSECVLFIGPPLRACENWPGARDIEELKSRNTSQNGQ